MGRTQEITHPYQERLTYSCHPYRSQFPGPSCPVRAGGRQKGIILRGAILGFHEWSVENLLSASRSVFNSLSKCTVCLPGWSQKQGKDPPGRGTRPLGTSGFKDPTQGHFLPYRQLPCPAPKGRGDRCVLRSSSPRKPGPAHSALQLLSASVCLPLLF